MSLQNVPCYGIRRAQQFSARVALLLPVVSVEALNFTKQGNDCIKMYT